MRGLYPPSVDRMSRQLASRGYDIEVFEETMKVILDNLFLSHKLNNKMFSLCSDILKNFNNFTFFFQQLMIKVLEWVAYVVADAYFINFVY